MSDQRTFNTRQAFHKSSFKHSLKPHLKTLSLLLIIGSLLSLSLLKQNKHVSALDNDFSDGITVDSTLDTADSNVGDGVCDDGDGNCTLRAAIEEANSDPDTSTIKFNITGTPDFINNSQNGYTIKPHSNLPNISEQTTIDGYSQPGAEANTVPAPQPFNGTLLIEIDGSEAGSGWGALRVWGDDSILRGLVINSFDGDAIDVASDNLTVQGCYIGVDPTGLIGKGNTGSGVAQINDDSDNLLFGGLDAEDRNIVGGNDNTGLSPNTGSDNWVIQGNYFGPDATGTASIPNSVNGGSGALSVDNSSGHLIGGPQPTAINVISGNNSMGIAPHNSPNLVIQHNYIGTDYTGLSPLPNAGTGISVSGDSPNVLIGGMTSSEANTIHNNGNGGITNHDQAQVSILRNSINNNTNLIGIDLNGDGLTFNDPLDPDAGPNDLLNFPIYTNVTEGSGNTTVDYLLDVPAGDYRIEFFSNSNPDPSGYGEGEEYLGFTNVTSTGSGEQSLSYTLTGVTGVTNLAMTTTEIDESSDGFGATSEFGGVLVDTSITKTLLNPQDISIGATVDYRIAYTNSGAGNVNLSGFSTPGAGPGLIYDLVPADLTNPSGYIVDGPLPSSQIIDVGNPDLTCMYAPAPAASSFGATTDPTIGIVICWLTGSDTTLEPGSSIAANLSFEVASDSDLQFTNYALGMAPESDPDGSIIGEAFSSGDAMVHMINADDSFNNFASAPYPVPSDPDNSSLADPGNIDDTSLASTGQSTLIYLSLSSILLFTGLHIYRNTRLKARS